MFRHTIVRALLIATSALPMLPSHASAAWGVPAMVKDINPGAASSSPQKLLAIGGRLFFAANDGTTGIEPMASNGTAAGTILLADIRPGTNSSIDLGCITCNALAIGSTAFFSAFDGTFGFRLWKSDGTPGGTANVYAGSTASDLVNVGGLVYFAGSPTGTLAYLYSSDGTPGVATQVSPSTYLYGNGMVSFLGQPYFPADDVSTGVELWTSNGTPAGTGVVSDLAPGNSSANPSLLSPVGNKLFFSATNGSGPGLCVTNGTLAGTSYLKQVRVGVLETTRGQIVDLGGTALFIGDDGTNGRELWKSDGTPGGTVMLKDVFPGSRGGLEGSSLVVMNGAVYFAADDGVHALELWKSDGTEAGTVMLKDINPQFGAFGPSSPMGLTNINGTLFFRATAGGQTGQQPWISDGTEAGTVQLATIFPNGASQADGFTDVGGTVYFSATDGVHGIELWSVSGASVDAGPLTGEPAGVTLSEARPNPARFGTRVTYTLASPQHVRLRLFDMSGRAVRTVEDREMPAGSHEARLEGGNLPSGVYFCRLETAIGSLQRKVSLTR